MHYRDVRKRVLDLEVAAGVGGGEVGCAGAADVADFSFEKARGFFGLGDGVDTGAAAAPVGFGQFC